MIKNDSPIIHTPIIHTPTGKFFGTFLEGQTTLVIAECTCGPDCCLTASLMPENFFTPSGDQGVRVP